MRHGAGILVLAVAIAGVAVARPAAAWDPNEVFAKGRLLVSVEGGGGAQNNLEDHGRQSDVEFWNAGARVSLLPLGTTGSGFFYGALEAGLEPFFQHYTHPSDADWAGLAAVARYHFLSLGRFVPWVELFAGAGGTGLKTIEIRSSFAFLLQGGVGASYFLTDRVAVYGGYRLEHVSNGHIEDPNRGFEANTGVVGMTFVVK